MMYHSLAKHLLEIILIAGLIEVAPVKAQDLEKAPAFSLQSVSGETHTLEQYKGKYVVLEWMNFRCRTVDLLYKNRVLPTMQQAFKEKDVVWLSIVSEALGKQGQVAPDKMRKQLEKRGGNQDAVLMDVEGIVGPQYEAVVSPHFALVDPEGMLIYQGAFDNQPDGELPGNESAINYVSDALNQSMNGKEVQNPVTEAYGCPIRYGR